MEWMGAGLPFEGTFADEPRLSTLADHEVPTCSLDDTVADARGRLGQWDLVLVVAGPERVVLGLVRAEALGLGLGLGLGLEDDRPIAEVMQEGPSTYRPHVSATEMSQTLNDSGPVPWVMVTTLSGSVVGLVRPEKVHAAAAGAEGG